jgi:hypothetical protein
MEKNGDQVDYMGKEYIYKKGYVEGFDDGIEAAKHCSNCELVKRCPDDDKAGFKCPYVHFRYLHIFQDLRDI